MRIAVDCGPTIERPLSGVGEYTARISHELMLSDNDVFFFVRAFRKRILPETFSVHRTLTVRFPNALLNLATAVLQIPKLTDIVKDADAFFFPNLTFFSLPKRVPYVVTVHDLSFFHFPSFYSWKRRLWHRAIGVRRIVQNAAGIIAVSRATADDCCEVFGVPRDRIAVIHSGVTDYPHTADDEQRVRGTYGLTRPYLLTLGTYEPRKNLLAVLEAFSIMRKTGYEGELVLAGPTGWSMRSFWRALGNHTHRNAIRVLSYVPEADKGGLYAGADVFLYPSVYEGFGFPPLEALLCATPVVAGHHTSLSELLADFATLVDVNNSREIAVAATAASRSVPQQDSDAIQQRYSWKLACAETRSALQNFFHDHASSHRY